MVYRLTILLMLFGVGSALAFNPFRAQVRTVYPTTIKTVGEAAQYLIEPAGYTLLLDPAVSKDAQEIAERPVGARAGGTAAIPLEEALLLLIGDESNLVVDHPHRLITFEKIKEDQ